jgi:hypothetical protein
MNIDERWLVYHAWRCAGFAMASAVSGSCGEVDFQAGKIAGLLPLVSDIPMGAYQEIWAAYAYARVAMHIAGTFNVDSDLIEYLYNALPEA